MSGKPLYVNAKEFIESRISISNIGCWDYVGYIDSKGYPNIRKMYLAKLYSVTRVHQLSYLVYRGDYNRSLLLRHLCNNRKCINPYHLYPGTHEDNMRDMALAGSQKGSKNPGSKLSEIDVLAILNMFGKFKINEIAKKFNVTRKNIEMIKYGKTWAHITGR